jgi:hypothetical protein
MAGVLFNLPKARAFTAAGRIGAGYKLYFYAAGTSTPLTVYQDAALTTAHASPVVADSAGVFPPVYVPVGAAYKVELLSASGVLQPGFPVDGVPAAIAPYALTAAEAAAGVTPTNYNYPPGNVLRYGTNTTPGTTNMAPAFQAAINGLPATGGVVTVPEAASYLLGSTVAVTKPCKIEIGPTTIICPASGYGIDVNVNDCEIQGSKNTTFRMTSGGAGAIRNNQSLRSSYSNFKIEPNNAPNSICFHQDGGWYVNVKNVEILKATTAASTDSIQITSTYTGVAGSTGSFGGAYVSTYENIVAARVRLVGDLTPTANQVTTTTFIDWDGERFIATAAVGIVLIRPVVQSVGGLKFDFDATSNVTLVGGDFELGPSTIYRFVNGCRGIYAFNNTISGTTNTYFTGDLPSNSYFMDDDQNVPISGHFQGHVGSAEPISYRNVGFTSRHFLGIHQDGDTFEIGANLRATSATEGALADTAKSGALLRVNASGQFKVFVASSGSNPRTLTEIALFDSLGLDLGNVPTYADEAAAGAGGLLAGRLYKTSGGDLRIKL